MGLPQLPGDKTFFIVIRIISVR